MKPVTLDKKKWSSLRSSLNNSYDLNVNWETVIKLFKKRIDNFYFDPIDKILEPNRRKGEGFAIVTLQCALIEMLASFKYGKIHNREKPETGGLEYEYKSSDKYFIKFLKTEDIFRDHFFIVLKNWGKHGNTPFNANDFYNCVRCGLMHEARTKKDWRINAKKSTTSKKFIEVDDEGIKNINRTGLHEKLKSYFNRTYIVDLKKRSEAGNKLRRFLARKLDHLHDIPRDTAFDWWKDE